MNTTATTLYNHLIGDKVGGPAIDPLTAPHSGDIYGIVDHVIGITTGGRLALALTNTYRITIPLDVAQGAYRPVYTPATADVTLPTGNTATMTARQVTNLMTALAQAYASIDPNVHGSAAAGAAVDVAFPDAVTLTMDAGQFGDARTRLAAVYGDLTAQDTALRDQLRAAYFAS